MSLKVTTSQISFDVSNVKEKSSQWARPFRMREKRKRKRCSLGGPTSRQPGEHTDYFRGDSVWSPKVTRLSISPFVAMFLERWLCVLIVANQSKTPKSSTAAAQLSGVFPLIMSATYPATRSAGNTV